MCIYLYKITEKENSVTRGIRMDDTSYKETEGCS